MVDVVTSSLCRMVLQVNVIPKVTVQRKVLAALQKAFVATL